MTSILKALLYLVISLLVIVSAYFINLSVSSRKQPDLGLFDNQLRVCPSTPNCVSSERQDTKAYIEPLRASTQANNIAATTAGDAGVTLWSDVKKAVVEVGGNIMTERDGYLHATFETTLLRYVDDVELRLDKTNRLIHIRSASRVGHSDMGANRVRVEKIRKAFLNNTFHDSSEK